jgi:hypothetical protein
MSYLNRLLLLSEKQIAVNLQRLGGQVKKAFEANDAFSM